MRIGFLTHQWPGALMGGIGAYTVAIARALAVQGHEAHIFTFTLPLDARPNIPDGVILHEVPDLSERVHSGRIPAATAAALVAGGEPLYRLAMGALLCDEVRAVHAHTPFDVLEGPEFEALALPLLLDPAPGLPIVTHIHSGSAINREGNQQPTTPRDLVFDALEFATILAADGLCAPAMQVIASTRHFVPIPRDPAIIPPPVEIPSVIFHAPPPDGPILFIGRLERVKGAELLGRALPSFLTRCPTATVHFIGPDSSTAPGGGSMQQWITAHLPEALRPRVLFLGQQTRDQIDEELLAASLVVIPSLFESFSLVCAEAMVLGRPVVASNDIGSVDLIGDTGLLFQRGNADFLADALATMYSDRDGLALLSKCAFERARIVLDPKHIVERRIAFYADAAINARQRLPFATSIAALPASCASAILSPLIEVTSFLSGSPLPSTRTPGTRLVAIMTEIQAATDQPAAVLLYGAGRHTARLLAEKNLWEPRGHRVVGLIDDHPRFARAANGMPATYAGVPVTPSAELLNNLRAGEEIPPIVLSTDALQEQFWEKTASFRTLGVPVYRLYT